MNQRFEPGEGDVNPQERRAPLDRRQFLLRTGVLVAVAAAAACQHTGGPATEDAEPYDNMRATRPGGANSDGGM